VGIELKITADNATELAALIADLAGGATTQTPETKARRSRKTETAPTDEGNAGTSSTASESPSSGTGSTQTETGTQSPADEPTIEYAQVRSAVMSLAAKKGRDAVIEVLSNFGVDNATKLKEEQWADALAELQKAEAA
jgi:hypothetical protein